MALRFITVFQIKWSKMQVDNGIDSLIDHTLLVINNYTYMMRQDPAPITVDDSLRLYLYQIDKAHVLLSVCIQERRTTFCASEGRDLPMNHHPINRLLSRQRILRLLWTRSRSSNGPGMLTIHTYVQRTQYLSPYLFTLVPINHLSCLSCVWDTKTRTNIWNAGEGKEFGFK